MGGVLLGGPSCFKKQRVSGGLMVFLEWWEDATSTVGRGEPSLWITRADRYGLSGNRGSACITLPQAYLYADSKTGAPTQRLIEFSLGACRELGLEPSRMNVKAIADAIVDFLPDLVRMPPEPRQDQVHGKPAPVIGEVKLVREGEVIHESTVS